MKRKKKGLGERMTQTGSAADVPSLCPVSSVWWRRARRAGALVVLLLFAFSLPGLLAKERKATRVVTGFVSDEADDPLVGAAVVLTDLQTGKKSATYTTAEGTYQYTNLQPTHDYEVQATHQGLSSQVRKASQFDPRSRIVLDLKIPPPKEE